MQEMKFKDTLERDKQNHVTHIKDSIKVKGKKKG